MKYAIITCINSNFAVKAEYTALDKAKVGFHQQCATLWNAEDVQDAEISIVDESLTTVVTEHIYNAAEAEPTAEDTAE
jgi:hypothetical protein